MAIVIAAMIGFTLREAVRPTPAAAAIANAEFPTLASGVSGPSVTAWQYILRGRISAAGHSTSQPITGQFDSTTKQNTKDYASGGSLGVVTPSVWDANAPYVNGLSDSNYIRAVESLMATRYDPASGSTFSMSINGSLSNSEKDEIRAFQSDAGITQTGLVDPETWQNLTFHYVPGADANNGWCTPSYSNGGHGGGGSGVYDPWVTDWVGTEIDEWGLVKNYLEGLQGGTQYGDLRFTDASRAHGGSSPPHSSHRTGMDLDIRPMRVDTNQCSYGTNYWSSQHDEVDTIAIINMLLITVDDGGGTPLLELIYFNDPDVQAAFPGLVSTASGHNDHLHVAFCTPFEGPNWAGNHTC